MALPWLSRRAGSAVFALTTLALVGLWNYAPYASTVFYIVIGTVIVVGLGVLVVVPAALGAHPRPTSPPSSTAASSTNDESAPLNSERARLLLEQGTGSSSDRDKVATSGTLTSAAAAAAPAGPTAAQERSPRSERLYYLDNLKAALVAIVVLHHVLGTVSGGGSLGMSVGSFLSWFQIVGLAVQGLDQGWFMCFFFFISAYFTPSSYDRKGPRAFLADKFKRLGISLVAYAFIFGPLLNLIMQTVTGLQALTYLITPSQTWFLAWLLIFNTAYALVAGGPDYIVCRAPSLTTLTALGFAVGIVQGIQIIAFPAPIFFLPISFGSLPFDIMFFVAGILARRNRWLDALVDLPKRSVNIVRAVVVLLSAVTFVWTGTVYTLGGGFTLMPKNPCGEPINRGGDEISIGGLIALLVAMSALLGIFAMHMSVASLDLFRRHLNISTPLTRFFSDNAYAVYLIHGWAVVPFAWSFIALVESAAGVTINNWVGANNQYILLYSATTSACMSTTTNEGAILFAGFIYISVLSFIAVYILASLLRRIPGIRDIL